MTLDSPTPAQLNSLRLSDEIAKRQQIIIYSRYLNNIGYFKDLQEQELEEPVYTETTEDEEREELERVERLQQQQQQQQQEESKINDNNINETELQQMDNDESTHSDISSNCSSVLSCDMVRTTTANSAYSDFGANTKCPLHRNSIRYKVIDVFLNRPTCKKRKSEDKIGI